MTMLDGFKVVSFNHFLMGPLGAQILADLGADVVAVEALDGAFQRKWSPNDTFLGEESLLFACANRNKRSLALNLRSPVGIEIAKKLILEADVLAENFRPGVMDRLGLGYDEVKALNPKIVYAAASGYGADGPYRDRPGQDLLVQALSGLAATTGRAPDGARAIGVSAVDHHGAALLAVGILAALHRAKRTGVGCRVDVSLLAAALDLQTESLTSYLNGPRPTSVSQPGNVSGWGMQAPYGIYPALDGSVAISLCTNKDLGEALEVLELSSIGDDENFKRRDEISELTEKGTRKFTLVELKERLSAKHVWHMPVNDYEAVERDPQVQHNEHIISVGSASSGSTLKLVSHPIRYDGRSPEVRLAPQPLGAQSREILTELGYSSEDIESYIVDDVIGTPEIKRERKRYELKRS
ncbi:CaiB/BaiF CoA-transferase family protein [Methylocapsa sp. S129]|uniref:CaiB/BaiF CoA transferase family protein n=1 Tax=Methylocapsa sp. S129 TaxID=1641869 RepID=UPI00131D7D45|nr:CoA transferase [Methylocapsa sp. S129]